MFKRDELKLLWPFYLSTFIQSALAIVPLILFVYFQFKGFGLGFASFLFALSTFGGLVFEIPTGVFADMYGRKKSVLIYFFSSAAIFLFIPFATKFFVALLFLLLGISRTFFSGANQAWIVDFLKQKKREELAQSYFTKSQSILAFGGILAGVILSSMLYFFDVHQNHILLGTSFTGGDLAWILEAMGCFIVGLILLFFTTEKVTKHQSSLKKSFKQSLNLSKQGFNYSFKHPVVFALIISAFFGTIFVNAWFISAQPFLVQNQISIKQFGFLESAIALFGIALPFLSQTVSKKVKKNVYLAFVNLLRFLIGFTILFVAGPVFAVIYLFIQRSTYYLEAPIEMVYLQEHIPSKQRATIGSVLSLFYSLSGLVAALVGSLLLDYIGPSGFIFFSSFLLIPVIIIFLRINKSK